MEHKVVVVKVSPKQLSRMRNGHKVRVKKPEVEGEGVCVMVNPENYSLVNRTFSRNKGLELTLSPTEIAANKEAAATMEGKGIFGKKFDRFTKKVLGKKGQKILYGIAKEFLPVAQAAIDVGTAAFPMAAPFGAVAKDYLANPSAYQGEAGAQKGRTAKEMAREYLQTQTQDLQAQLQSDILAKRDKALADLQARAAQQAAATAAAASAPQQSAYERLLAGNGLYVGGSGQGLYVGASGRGTSIVGLRGGMLQYMPPALQSQPYAANFHFRNTLPPQYQNK